ncbi:hypothetical protein D3C72_1724860 [compost metagenome]
MFEFADVFLDVDDIGLQVLHHRFRIERGERVQVVTQLETLFRVGGLVQDLVQLGLQGTVHLRQAVICDVACRIHDGLKVRVLRSLGKARLLGVLQGLPRHGVRRGGPCGQARQRQQFLGLVVFVLVLDTLKQLRRRQGGRIGVQVQAQRVGQFDFGVFGLFGYVRVIVGPAVLLI